ncbi:coiled-coil-helix-coiled-coil-helix domain-containing protein 5 isoform X3 [Theropithecus gelada]|nr:coiled-coil-helix-coiled-coil-helix domain-containing protein 5 isoform X3 [Theropithecus gelada]
MQAALEVTARYCGRELEQYGQCVAAKPESWQRDCHYLKMSIAQCTSSQSARPVLSLLRPSRSVFDRTRQLWATVRSICAASCSALSRCSHHVHLQLWRQSHFLPPEDSSDCRKTGHE